MLFNHGQVPLVVHHREEAAPDLQTQRLERTIGTIVLGLTLRHKLEYELFRR